MTKNIRPNPVYFKNIVGMLCMRNKSKLYKVHISENFAYVIVYPKSSPEYTNSVKIGGRKISRKKFELGYTQAMKILEL